MIKQRKVFVLGDSRTGTTSIHKFLKSVGYNSIHYFFKESGVSEPAHLDFETNWIKLKNFIDSGAFNAFSDYPARTFYRKLIETYTDDYFILTTRKDIETWKKSMSSFFGKFNIKINLDELTKIHVELNDKIRNKAKESGVKFCEICIDDDYQLNGSVVSKFLNLEKEYSLGWENKSDSYSNNLWSFRVTLYDTDDSNFVDYVERICYPSKGMLSEYGWVFLVNDSSKFLQYCYGGICWDDKCIKNAFNVFDERIKTLSGKGIIYRKFIMPEKSSVYPEFLPKIFHKHKLNESRPAILLTKLGFSEISYPLDILIDAKSYGFLYFRGDSHANWMGSFFFYLHIIEVLNSSLINHKARNSIKIGELVPELASYSGDLYSQLNREQRQTFSGAWSSVSFVNNIEYLVRFKMSERSRKSFTVDVPEIYLKNLGNRPVFIYESSDKNLPKAVVFRDSTSDMLMDLLAEHFSRVVFIWYKGFLCEDIIEIEKPDVVLHIMAERFTAQYGNFKPFAKCMSLE